jgi:beta-galactosidase
LPSYRATSRAWVLANDTSSPNPAFNPNTTTKPYLFADQYGFHTGTRLWRGVFFSSPASTTTKNGSTAAPTPTGVFLNVQGGTAHAWSAYLNGHFLGSWLGRSDAAAGNMTLLFKEGMVNTHGKESENVLLVVHDDTGHDQLAAAVNPRGILNATLLGAGVIGTGFAEWRVAGTAGVDKPEGSLDPLRTRYNEGGLAAERLGWHLPGFDDSDSAWEKGEGPREGFTGAGVRFYRGRLPLDVPEGMDVSLAFRFKPVDVEKEMLGYRVLLFVNGWQYGRYYPSIASEDTFPVPAGVLDYSGENVIGLAVWALQERGARVDVEVVVKYAVDSSLDVTFDGSYLRPGWDPVRLQYA